MTFRGSSEPQVAALDDDAVMDAVEELASELETFAFERERVLAKLDIRAAAHARRTARELRLVVTCLPLADGAETREGGFAKLGELLGRAHALLEGVGLDAVVNERLDAPGRRADGDPPMPASRDAKSTPAPTSDIRKNSRTELELDYENLGATLPGEVDPALAGHDEDLPAILHGTIAPLHPNQRPTAQALAALRVDDTLDDRDPTPASNAIPIFGDDDPDTDFDDETVAKKVAWQRSGNRVLGR